MSSNRSKWHPHLNWSHDLLFHESLKNEIHILYFTLFYFMGLGVRKPVFGVLRTTKAQTSLSDQGLCFSLIGKYHIRTCYERNFNVLASLCRNWVEPCFVRNPEDRFCHDEAQLLTCYLIVKLKMKSQHDLG